MYTRAAASDYDDWARVHGNTGWSASDLLPLLRKVRRARGTAASLLFSSALVVVLTPSVLFVVRDVPD